MKSFVQAFAFGVATLLVPFPQRVICQPIEDSVNFAAAPAPAPSGVSAQANKKIAMVADTLQDILQSVVNEEKQETAVYNKYMQWCKTEKAAIAQDISETQTELANAKVLSQEQVASIEGLKLYIAKTKKEISENKDATAQAIALRNDENDKYTEEMQINAQSIRQINAAIAHVGKVQKQGGFLQNGILKTLQINQPGESNYVLGVMKGLHDRLKATREELKKTEAEKVEMHNAFLDTKSKALKSMTNTLVEKGILLTETEAKLVGVKQKIGKLTEELSKLIDDAKKAHETCETTTQEWTQRQEDRTKEKAALSEAIRYLKETALEQLSPGDAEDAALLPPSFVQTASSSEDEDAESDENDMFDENHVEGRMRKDTFNGVKTVVSKLIVTHHDTQKEEKTKKEYCEKEIASKDDEKATTTDALAAVKANIEKKTAEVQTLEDEVKKLYQSIDQLRKSLEDAGKVRKQQYGLYVSGTKDRALAIKVLRQAKTVLQAFYDQNLLQDGAPRTRAQAPAPAPARSQAPARWRPGNARKSIASFGAVSMIQEIADDIAKEQKDAAMQERDAADAYSELQKDTQKNTDDKQQDITDRVTLKAKLGVQINTLKETQTEKTNDLTSINKQLTALHSECDELLKFYDKRKKARAFEVSQLKDVMDILSGSSLAVRTGLTQESDDNMNQLPADFLADDAGDRS